MANGIDEYVQGASIEECVRVIGLAQTRLKTWQRLAQDALYNVSQLTAADVPRRRRSNGAALAGDLDAELEGEAAQ